MIEIRGRAGTLADSLADLLRRDGHSTLNAFVFKSLDTTVRHRLAAQLKETDEQELDRALRRADGDVARGVASLLEECLRRLDPALDAKAMIKPLEDGWRCWIDELDPDDIVVKNWPIHTRFNVNAQIRAEGSIDRNIRTDAGREELARVRATMESGSEHRSDISELLAEARHEHSDDEDALDDIDLIDGWYSRLRYRALAARHGCTCALADRPWIPAITPTQALIREALGRNEPPVVALPRDVLTALADLSAEQFAEFVRHHRRSIVGWWEDRQPDALRELADGLAGFTRERKRASLGVVQTLPAAGGFGGAAIGGLGGPAGALIGTVAKEALERRRSEQETLRVRILESIEDRLLERR